MRNVIVVILLTFSAIVLSAQSDQQEYMLDRLNELRANGCTCGKQYYGPVRSLQWDNTLESSALNHANDMKEKKYFSHYSKDGKDIGDRIFAVGYNWSFVGENLGIGQKDYEEVFQDWIHSESHCQMMMSPDVTEVAIVKVGKFWVQHFGKPYEYGTF